MFIVVQQFVKGKEILLTDTDEVGIAKEIKEINWTTILNKCAIKRYFQCYYYYLP